jgi:predicted HTH domain antitoxin
MKIPFEQLPDDARIWIYQANRAFTDQEIKELKPALGQFIEQWTAHGSNLHAGYDLPYKRFIVLGLDQDIANASGCSIDASVHFIQELEKAFEVDLLDKMNVTFKQGEYLTHKSLMDFKKMVKKRSVSPKTIVFNNLVNTKEEYKHYWEVPLQESWHKRFL